LARAVAGSFRRLLVTHSGQPSRRSGLAPTSSQLQNATESVIGPFHQPQAVYGEYARTIGEFAPSALVPEGGLLWNAIRYGIFPALASETAGQLTKGSDAERWVRAVAAIAAAGFGAWRHLGAGGAPPEISERLPERGLGSGDVSAPVGGAELPDASGEVRGPTPVSDPPNPKELPSSDSPPAMSAEASSKPGSFSIIDWSGYPDDRPRPSGPFRLLDEEEYQASRKLANRINRKLRDADPAAFDGSEIHELHPVKFGGNPTDLANKYVVPINEHRLVTAWWERRKWDFIRMTKNDGRER
jgi:hypothetical protein